MILLPHFNDLEIQEMELLKRIEENKPLMIMLIGLPGSGKSTIAQSILVKREREEL